MSTIPDPTQSVYTFRNALNWGICSHHYKESNLKSLSGLGHGILTFLTFFPIVGQLFSLLEWAWVKITTPTGTARKVDAVANQTFARGKETSTAKEKIQKTELAPKANVDAVSKKQKEQRAGPSTIPERMKVHVNPGILAIQKEVSENKLSSSTLLDMHPNVNQIMTQNKESTYRDACVKAKINYDETPPLVSHSEFVTQPMAQHLMSAKKATALAVKYLPDQHDKITNMEGALHTFVTPVTLMTMNSDYCFTGHHDSNPVEANKVRVSILSAQVQPDFENHEVLLQIAQPREEETVVKDPPSLRDPHTIDRDNDEARAKHDEDLRKLMVYHLTENHYLPSLKSLKEAEARGKSSEAGILTFEQAMKELEEIIQSTDNTMSIQNRLQDKFVKLGNHYLSLEVLFSTYVHQIRNEFSALDQLVPRDRGYIYTIDPPSIFTRQIDGTTRGGKILNRLQILAFKHLSKNYPFPVLRAIGFNNFAQDPNILDLFAKAFPESMRKRIAIMDKNDLFQPNDTYHSPKGLEDCLLILHNNSDGFGQNIENEAGRGSMDAIYRDDSDAGCRLKRENAHKMIYM